MGNHTVVVLYESGSWSQTWASYDEAMEDAKSYVQSDQYRHDADQIMIFDTSSNHGRTNDDILDGDTIDQWHYEYLAEREDED